MRLKRIAVSVGLGLWFFCSGCSPARFSWSEPSKDTSTERKIGNRPTLIRPAQWLLLPDAEAEASARLEPDGSRLLVQRGVRIVERIDGSFEQSEQRLPDTAIKTLKLPERLGGGYLFFADAANSTSIWKAKEWTGELVALAKVDPQVSEIVPGFDRLYLVGRRLVPLRAIDATSGEMRDLTPLPPAPAYGGLAFVDDWFGAVNTDIRGLLVSFDAGASWLPLTLDGPATQLAASNDVLRLRTTESSFELDASGALRRRSEKLAESLDWIDSDEIEEPEPESSSTQPATGVDLGRDLLRQAVLRGWPETKNTAIVAIDGALVRVRLSDGALLAIEREALGAGECQAVKLGPDFGFVCSEDRRASVVYAYAGELSAKQVLRFNGPRFISDNGRGGLVIRGGCDENDPADPGIYCLRAADGRLREVRVRGDIGAERVSVLSDGRGVVLIPPRLGARGTLTLIDDAGSKRVKLELPKAKRRTLALLKRGLWLDGLVEYKKDRLFTWVAGGQPFVGVGISLNGKVRVGNVQSSVIQTHFAGPLAMVLTSGGVGYETTNYGFDWKEIDLPASLELFDPTQSAPQSDIERTRGCSPVGCSFGEWLRLGYSSKQDPEEVGAPEPKPVSEPSPGYTHFGLSCTATGEVARPTRRSIPLATIRNRKLRRASVLDRLTSTSDGGSLESSAFRPFIGVSPPPRRGSQLGFDFGDDEKPVQYRAYVWGDRGPGWMNTASWAVRVNDPFDVDGIWSSAATRSPWDDALIAAQTFGQDASGQGSVDWNFDLDASGRFGALRVRARSTEELHLVMKDKPIVTVTNAAAEGLDNIAGAVRVRGVWYLGVRRRNGFRLYRIELDRAVFIRDYIEFAAGRNIEELVRTNSGDRLGIWVRTKNGWYLHSLDPADFSPSPPRFVPLRELAGVPQPCASDVDGWELVSPVPLLAMGPSNSNTNIDFEGVEQLAVRETMARVLVNDRQVCLSAVTTQVDGTLPRNTTFQRGNERTGTVPLTLGDRATDMRFGFRCGK